MKLIFTHAKARIIEIRKNNKQVYQEGMMYYKYSEDVYVAGTPDVAFYDEAMKIWRVVDWKFSTHSWYGNEDVTKTDMQKVIYPLMIMDYMEVKEVYFEFRCYDKKT